MAKSLAELGYTLSNAEMNELYYSLVLDFQRRYPDLRGRVNFTDDDIIVVLDPVANEPKLLSEVTNAELNAAGLGVLVDYISDVIAIKSSMDTDALFKENPDARFEVADKGKGPKVQKGSQMSVPEHKMLADGDMKDNGRSIKDLFNAHTDGRDLDIVSFWASQTSPDVLRTTLRLLANSLSGVILIGSTVLNLAVKATLGVVSVTARAAGTTGKLLCTRAAARFALAQGAILKISYHLMIVDISYIVLKHFVINDALSYKGPIPRFVNVTGSCWLDYKGLSMPWLANQYSRRTFPSIWEVDEVYRTVGNPDWKFFRSLQDGLALDKLKNCVIPCCKRKDVYNDMLKVLQGMDWHHSPANLKIVCENAMFMEASLRDCCYNLKQMVKKDPNKKANPSRGLDRLVEVDRNIAYFPKGYSYIDLDKAIDCLIAIMSFWYGQVLSCYSILKSCKGIIDELHLKKPTQLDTLVRHLEERAGDMLSLFYDALYHDSNYNILITDDIHNQFTYKPWADHIRKHTCDFIMRAHDMDPCFAVDYKNAIIISPWTFPEKSFWVSREGNFFSTLMWYAEGDSRMYMCQAPLDIERYLKERQDEWYPHLSSLDDVGIYSHAVVLKD